jgi:LysM repeat protein
MPVPQVDASPEPPVAPEQLMALPETEDPADYDYELPPIADPTWLQPVPPVDDAEAEDGPELGRLVPMEPVEPATPAAPSYPEANVPPPFVPAAIPPVGPEAWSHPQPPFASMPDDLAPPMPYRAEDQAEPPGRLTGRPIDTGNAPRLNSQARPPRKKSETPAAEWSKPRRFEAYPSLGARVRMRGFSPVLVGAFVVAITALLLFLLPSFLSGGGAALPTRTLAPTATPVPTPTPAPTAQSYTVKAGDVLGTIATRFNVTVSQITCFNDLKNPDRLSIGQVLLIPPEDYFCPEPTPTPRR